MRELLPAPPASPFVKWAGGKAQLLGQLEPLLPKQFGRYIEPFVGGGALFFHLYNLGRITKGAILSDLNAELMNCYRVLRHKARVAELIELLRRHARRVMDADYYYRVRAWDRQRDFLERRSPVERAARTIFLNHACYNGLYRLNSKGQFNVPYGKWARPPRLFNEDNLWACRRALQGIKVHQESFESCIEWAEKGDFIYLDPPYDPLSPTSSFTTYTGAVFGTGDQRGLADVFRDLDEFGCLLLLTNSATPLIRRIYRGYRMESLLAARPISCKGTGRGKIQELAVLNY